MATERIGTDGGKGKELVISQVEFRNATYRPGMRIRYSSASLQGLVQSYFEAEEKLQFFNPMPDRLAAALKNPATRRNSIFNLRNADLAQSCLELLDEGNIERVKMYLERMAYDLFRRADKQIESEE